MFSRRNLLHALVHLGGWLVAGGTIGALFADSPSHYAYGLLSGWWAALYLGFIFGVPLRAAVPSVFIFAALVIVDSVGHMGLLHDTPSMSLDLLVFLLPALAVYLSPMFVNWAARAAVKRWQIA